MVDRIGGYALTEADGVVGDRELRHQPLPGQAGGVQLFGPRGSLDSVTPDTQVTIRRGHKADTEQHHNPR
jgi:hypothetical protein